MKWFLLIILSIISLLLSCCECGEKYIAIPMSDIELVPIDQTQVGTTTTSKIFSTSSRLPRGFSRNFYDMGAHTGPNGEYAWHWKTYKAKPNK